MKGVAHNQGIDGDSLFTKYFQGIIRRVQRGFSSEEFNIILETLSVLGIFEKKNRLTTYD